MVKRRGNGIKVADNSTSTEENESEYERIRRQRRHNHPQQHQQQPQTSTPNPVDNPEILLQMLMEVVKKIWRQIKQASSFIMVELRGNQIFDTVAQWCIRNPNISIILAAGSVVMFLPFLICFGFCLSTIVLTFTGLLFLEGTLLTVVSVMLFGCLSVLAIALIFLAVIGVAGFFGFVHIYDLYGGLGRHKTAVVNFIKKEKVNLRNYLIDQQVQRSSTITANETNVLNGQ